MEHWAKLGQTQNQYFILLIITLKNVILMIPLAWKYLIAFWSLQSLSGEVTKNF